MTLTASLEMTEAEAMAHLIGQLVTVTRGTQSGTETIVGVITTPLMIEEEAKTGAEVITAVSIEGEIVESHIAGLPGAIAEGGEHVTLTLIPVHEVEGITA